MRGLGNQVKLLVSDVWNSFRSLPIWVQIWTLVLVIPVNLASVFFVNQPHGWIVAVFAIGGMMPSVFLALRERGCSKAMSISHLALWIPLVAMIYPVILADYHLTYRVYLSVLLTINVISLLFDIRDGWYWMMGAREVSRMRKKKTAQKRKAKKRR
jgi:hypothetical protein